MGVLRPDLVRQHLANPALAQTNRYTSYHR